MGKEIERPAVVTRKGVLWGTTQENGTLAFLGVPFAQPPINSLRWREPLELPDSDQVFDCGALKPIPIQTENDDRYRGIPKSEDCLYLNVFAADLEQTNKPVLVWVYGGAYVKGGTAWQGFNGNLMVRENPDIILVTVTYRLGVLGSLNLSKLDPSGRYRFSNNLARLDLQSALKWVHENIAAFGGDPGNVTVWGHSAGSSNISAQLMMPQSRAYFQKAIMHSSFAVDIGTTSWEDSLGAADTFFGFLGNPALEELLAIPSGEIFAAQEKLQRSSFFGSERKPFSVVLDDIVVPKDGFRQLADGAAAGIDVIAGTCCGEYDQQFRALGVEKRYDFLKSQVGRKVGDLDAVIRFYREHNPQKPLDEIYMDIKNDLWLRIPGNLMAQALCRSGKSHTWMYYTELRKPDGSRAHHGSEFAMVFGREDKELVTAETARKVRQTWLEFVRKGVPQGGGLPDWPEYNAVEHKTMVIGEISQAANGIRIPEMNFLMPLFEEKKNL